MFEQSNLHELIYSYPRTQHISRRGYKEFWPGCKYSTAKLGKGWKGIFSIEKAFYIFHKLQFCCILSNLNFFFEKYSSWERIGSCIFSNLHFFFGKYSSWERIGSCNEVQFLGENASLFWPFVESWLWKSNFGTFWHLPINPVLKIQKYFFGMLILKQKSFQFCRPHLKTR